MGSPPNASALPTDTARVDAYLEHALSEASGWYKQADSKAQTILGFTGVYLSIVVGSFVLKRDVTGHVLAGIPFRACLVLILLLYVLGIGFCVAALWSRGIMRQSSSHVFFFGSIANYPSGRAYLRAAQEILADGDAVRQGWADEIRTLSWNTRRKHRLVNLAVVCSGTALLGTIVVGLMLFFQPTLPGTH